MVQHLLTSGVGVGVVMREMDTSLGTRGTVLQLDTSTVLQLDTSTVLQLDTSKIRLFWEGIFISSFNLSLIVLLYYHVIFFLYQCYEPNPNP